MSHAAGLLCPLISERIEVGGEMSRPAPSGWGPSKMMIEWHAAYDKS